MRAALILGDSGGIGAALAAKLRAEGCAVTGLSRRRDGLDLTDEASVAHAAARLRDRRFDLILNAIGALEKPEDIAAFLRTSYAKGQGYVFGFGPSPDFKDSSMNIAYVAQAGLGLPDRDYYFAAKHADIREAYVAHIANILELAGADKEAAAAQAAAPRAGRRQRPRCGPAGAVGDRVARR